MGTSYTGLRVQDTYNAIIKIGDNSNLTGTAKLLSDGLGNDSSIYLSTTRLGIGISPSYQFHTSGNAKIGGDVIISGDLTVNGDLTYLNVTDLAVEDPLIKLAKDNTANTLDIGLFGKYVATGTKYKGFFNDASDDKFKLFIGSTVEPGTTVNTSASGYTKGNLVIGNLEATGGDFSDTVYIDDHLEIENSSGYGYIELGGSSGGYIDLKGPFSNDFDLRVFTDGTNSQINAIAGALDITSNSGIDLQYQGSNKLTVISTGIDVTGNLFVSGGIKDSDGDLGTSGQLLSSTGTGTNWIDFEADVAKRLEVTVKNVSGGELAKGVVVHAAPTADPPEGNVIEVIAADANDAAKMPAIGVLNETIADEAEGEAVMFGAVSGIDTSSFSIGDELYVSETAGEFTATKPTAYTSQVQKIAVVIKSSANNGLIKVFGAGRANDVPNRVDRNMNFIDDTMISFGDDTDFKIYHDAVDSYLQNQTGDLIIQNLANDKDIVFKSDNGSGGVIEYFRVDGSTNTVPFGRSPHIVDNLKLYFGNDTANDASIKWDSTASQLFIDGESKFLDDLYVVGNLGIGTVVADSPIHVSKGGLDTSGQDYGVHIGVLESGSDRYSAIEIVSNGALSGWIDFSNTDSDNDYNERIRGGAGVLDFYTDTTLAVSISNAQDSTFKGNIIIADTGNIDILELQENSTHFGRVHYLHSDFTTAGTNIAESLLIVSSSQSPGGIVIRADKPSSEIIFAIGNSNAENIVMKITDGANGVEFFPTTTAEGGHIALRADTDGSYRYAIDNYNDTLRIVRQADADATGGVVVASVDGNGDFTIQSDLIVGRTGHFTSDSSNSRVLYLDQHAADNGNIVQFRDNTDTYVWELVGRNNQFYIFNNSLSRYSLYVNPTDNFIGINGNSAPKAFLHVTDGTNSYPTDSNNKLVVESTGHTYIGLGGGDASDVGIHFGDSTAVNRGRLAYIHSEDAMKISTNGAVRYILDGGGNVGYNSPVKASTGTWRNFGFGSLRMFGRANANNPDGGIGTNFYFNTANEEKRVSAHAASRIWFNDNVINFDNADTGTADSSITWNTRMQIRDTGGLALYRASDPYIQFYEGSDNRGDIFIDTSLDSLVVRGAASHGVHIKSNGNSDASLEGIYLATNDNVGFGTKTPGRGLTIDRSNEFAALEIIKNNSGNQIVYLGTGSSGAGEVSILQLKDGTVEQIRMYSAGTSWIKGGNLVIGNTTSNYDFEVFGTDAQALVHYTGESRGGLMALSGGRIALSTTTSGDDLVFGYNSTAASSADFVERMRIDNGTGDVLINATSKYNGYPSTFVTQTLASSSGDVCPILELVGNRSANSGNQNAMIQFFNKTSTAVEVGRISSTQGSAVNSGLINFHTASSGTLTEQMAIKDNGHVNVKTALRVFGNNVTDISETNSPTTTSVNLGTYINEYSFIDLSSSNASGSWIDFSNANGTDYRGRIRYNFTSDVFKIYAGAGERVNIGIGQTNVMNTFKNSNATYDLLIGQASFTWGGNTSDYPTVYGSHTDRWVMYTFPHITCLQNGVNGHTGNTTGAKIRFASNPAASSFWDAGVDLQYNAADRFSIARAGAIMINCLTPNSTYSGLASRDWTIFGSGSRAGAIAINDIAGANYAIHGGGYDLTFSKSVNGTSLANALAILGDNAADSSPDVRVYNNFDVQGTATVLNAATVHSNSSSRVLYLKQQSTNSGNIIQFQDQSSNNTWELVGRNNIFYLYNNMNSVGYVLNVRADNGYLKIGNSNNASYHLDVEGTIRASGDVIAFSDKRVKENIITINSALDKVTKLRGVTYTRKDTDDKSTKVGVIAQEVLEVLPEIVSKDDEGMYSVAYGNMAGVFIEAIKELKAEVDSLKQEIKELKK